MANESIRLRTVPGESKNIVVKLDQDFDFLEVLSLKITQEDLYQTFCANYGVVVGRAIANQGFGVPNAKVSIFIPISSEDEKNVLIKDFYPFKSPTDKNYQGVRYNLLLSKTTCYLNKPVGNFPTKEDLLDNDIVLEVFDKYYKYTTRTNEAGDFMLFGVPVGQHIIHMDVDLSDIGKLSLRPYDMIANGYPEKLFESYVEFKKSTNLDTLPQIKTINASIDVIPFWGDSETCEIGITRTDFDVGGDITSTALFFGSIFTDSGKMALNKSCNPKNDMGEQGRLVTSEGIIDMIRVTSIDPEKWVNNKEVYPLELEKFSINDGELIDEDGVFVISLPMNIGHVITNEFGELEPSPNPNVGLATKGMYRFNMKFAESENGKYRTANMLFPNLGVDFGGFNYASSDRSIEYVRFSDNITDYNRRISYPAGTGGSVVAFSTPTDELNIQSFRKQFHLFEWKQLYTIAHYLKKYKKGPNRFSFIGIKNTDVSETLNPFPFTNMIYDFNIIYFMLVLLSEFFAGFLTFFIALVSICLQFSVRLAFRICIGKNCRVYDREFVLIHICTRLCPFQTLGFLFPAFKLPCESAPDGESYRLPEEGSTWASCNTSGCNGAPGCSCLSDSPCAGDDACFKIGTTGLSQSTNSCLESLTNWKCCVKLQSAERNNVIKTIFTDAWVFGTAYLFKYKYKKKFTSSGEVKKEKFCGRGSVYGRSFSYRKNRCCLDEIAGNTIAGGECTRCLLENESALSNDVNGITYCNELMSTKIISLGRVEMCPETLEEIQNAKAVNGVLKEYKQDTDNTNFFYTGSYYENGWDGNYWVQELQETSYQDPSDVTYYLAKENSCEVKTLFLTGVQNSCHEYTLKNDNYFFIKEVSKIYTDIETNDDQPRPFGPNGGLTNPYADMTTVDSNGNADPSYGGFIVDRESASRFSPCGNDGDCVGQPQDKWSTNQTLTPLDDTLATSDSWDRITSPERRNNKNTRNNIPYYYFGINPGKTAINKLRKQYFTKK